MRLQPRNYKYTKHFKTRYKVRFHTPKLQYGDIGLVINSPLLFTSRRLDKIKLKLKHATKKRIITHRYFWLMSAPHLPLTRKSVNARMGKGTGKLKSWYTVVYGGVTLFEFRNLRLGRALFFCKVFRMGMRSLDFPLLMNRAPSNQPLSRKVSRCLPFH